MSSFREEYSKWLASPSLAPEEREELLSIRDDDAQIRERFYAPLAFGTAGLRGVMGPGTARMNVHTVRLATQGFASVILAAGTEAAEKGTVVCYDCRNNSELFARETARVFAGNGIRVRIFAQMRPTPELSFAVREYGAQAGVNITASHNPREYNGYKVYWEDGAQLPPEQASQVASAMAETDIFTGVRLADYDCAVAEGLITELGEETDELFLSRVLGECKNGIDPGLKIVYTPFHGTGAFIVPEALRRAGAENIFPVSEQSEPDGDFPTVKNPNPEYPESFYLAERLAEEVGADVIIGTDPDTDRIALEAKKDGVFRHINGNRFGVLLLNYLISSRVAAGALPENAYAVKSIVSTEMVRALCEANGVKIYDTFTGFKYMAEKIREVGADGTPIMAFEESYGYMPGFFVRDKDAVTSAVLGAEMASFYLRQGKSLWDVLDELYKKYGYYEENTVSLVMPGADGVEKMAVLMKRLRAEPPQDICGTPVAFALDYLDGSFSGSLPDGFDYPTGSNVLRWGLADGTAVVVRPSGTEPKIKLYILARGETAEECSRRAAEYSGFAEKLKEM